MGRISDTQLWRALSIAVLVMTVSGCSLLGQKKATPTPAPTPPPATATADTGLLYEDSFTDPASGWPAITSDVTKSGYHPPDAFHLEVSKPNTAFWVFRHQDFGDFSAETKVFLDSAADGGQWRHGLAFRMNAEGHFYAFTINPRPQTWQVLKHVADGWQTLAEGTNASIVSEPKAVNTLRVDAGGANFTFSINGQPVVMVSDGEYASGDIGFVVETFDQTKAHLHFDSLTVRKFDPGAVPAAPTAGPVATATPSLSPTPTPTATRTPRPTGQGGAGGAGGTNPTAIFRTAAAQVTTIVGTVVPAAVKTACAIAGSPCP
ncbi:MAG: hypothetical protein HY260_03410 [Chloroflexi bacterium]|nr:hypothetical protein [Chloroflexota bacterium]